MDNCPGTSEADAPSPGVPSFKLLACAAIAGALLVANGVRDDHPRSLRPPVPRPRPHSPHFATRPSVPPYDRCLRRILYGSLSPTSEWTRP